eukprot:1701331-Pyramimonas_sp.AAC.1
MAEKFESQFQRPVDAEGIGKPAAFDGAEAKCREWAAKFCSPRPYGEGALASGVRCQRRRRDRPDRRD